MSEALPKRSELPKEQQWSIETVFANEAEWEKAFQEVSASLDELKPFAGRLGESAQTLLQALQKRDRLNLAAQKVGLYASLNLSTDGANPTYAAMNAQASSLIAQVNAAAAFIVPEILRIEPAKLEQFMAQEPELAVYRHYLERLQLRRAHIRSAEVEEVMAQVGDPLASLSAAAAAATNADMVFRPVEFDGMRLPVSHATIGGLLVHESPLVRRLAWEHYADGHLALKNTLAATLQGSMKAFVFQARARNYPSSLAMSLAFNHIPQKVYDNLLETFRAHLPLWHRYWAIRKKASGGSLHTYDVPTYDAPAPFRSGPTLSFAEAAEMVIRGMESLGPEYVEPMRKGLFEERWVDWGLNQGKRAGAYSSGLKGTYPFIFMSFQNDLFSMSTLAHELGHSMHSYFTRLHQPHVYCRYSLFVAEVASNFNQALTRARLLEEATDDDFKIAVLEEAFANFHRYLFVMPTLARFELECYQRLERGEALNAAFLTGRMAELFAEGYGGEVEIDPERLGASWMNFSHLYSPYYVYQYATGIAAANALAQDVLREGEPAARRYLEFLKAGDSVFPLDALRIAGIDMESPEPIRRAFGVLEHLIDEFERLVSSR